MSVDAPRVQRNTERTDSAERAGVGQCEYGSCASTSSRAALTIAPAPGISAACNAGADGMRTSGVARRLIGALRREKRRSLIRAATSAPNPPVRFASWTIRTRPPPVDTASAIASSSSGASQRRSKTQASIPRLAELVSGPLGLERHRAPADDRNVTSSAAERRPSDRWGGVEELHLAFGLVKAAGFDHDRRVGILDRGSKHAVGVIGVRWHADSQPRNVGEQRFEALRVLCARPWSGALLGSDDERCREAARARGTGRSQPDLRAGRGRRA